MIVKDIFQEVLASCAFHAVFALYIYDGVFCKNSLQIKAHRRFKILFLNIILLLYLLFPSKVVNSKF